MRAIREQPRLVIARALAALCLIAAGAVIAVMTHDDDRAALRATEVRLVSVQRSERSQRSELQRVRVEFDSAVAARARAARALRRLRRANARLTLQLRILRRARHRRNRQP